MKLACVLLITAFSTVIHAQDAPQAWDTGHADPRRLQANREGLAIATRVRARQKVSDDRNAAQYAENRRRCAEALRVADLCGKFAGTFYCDDKGFQPIPEDERVERAALDNAGKYRMEHCALKAARSTRAAAPSRTPPSPPSPAAPAAAGPATAQSR